LKEKISVLVPLHNSKSFIEIVDKNIAELKETANLIISDAFENDDSLSQLRKKWQNLSNVKFLGRRDIKPGWIAHYESLLSMVETNYFMWLAHDDEIKVEYLEKCIKLLESDSEISAAVGQIISIEGEGLLVRPQPLLPKSDQIQKYLYRANGLFFEWNLGVLFRAVFKRQRVYHLPISNIEDRWSDEIWAYGFCINNLIAQDPTAIYKKRFYVGSTHSFFEPHLYSALIIPGIIEQIKCHFTNDIDKFKCIDELIQKASKLQRNQLDSMMLQIELKKRECIELASRVDDLEINFNNLVESKSWRITAPLRKIHSYFRPTR
jgi:hypothetical protein